MTEGHEVWTQQAGWTSACQLSVGDAFVDAAGEPVEIVDIVFDPTPTTVYNLEVDGAFTYFAEGVWVHNDSCTVLHHIATNKNWIRAPQWSRKFAALFSKGGMTLEDAANVIELETHAGPHSQAYHQLVWNTLNQAIHGLKGAEESAGAIRRALDRLSDIIRGIPRSSIAKRGAKCTCSRLKRREHVSVRTFPAPSGHSSGTGTRVCRNDKDD